MRTEQCVCLGPPIAAPTLKAAGMHVAVHNASPAHVAWRRVRAAQDAYADELRYLAEVESERTIHRVPQSRSTTGTSRDLSGSKTDTSAGTEGAA